MGADFLILALPIPTGGLDFEAARAIVTSFYDNDKADPLNADVMLESIDIVERAAKGNSRESQVLQFLCDQGHPITMLVSGGMSWGDSPTEDFGALSNIAEDERIWNALTRETARGTQ